MSLLSPEGQTLVSDIAARHGFSEDAVTHMLIAVNNGAGTQAQFNHWEFGGMGQWSMGGMIMIGDMFNNGLKARVDGLCNDLSGALATAQVFQPAPRPVSHQSQSHSSGGMQMQSNGMGGGSSLFVSGGSFGSWWPEDLGQPGSTGAQNDMKYAYFPMISRLAILVNGVTTVYDTGAHQIGGFGQQQGGDQSLTFTSQFGLVRVADLPVVQGGAQMQQSGSMAPVPMDPVPMDPVPMDPPPAPAPAPAPTGVGDSDAIFAALEKLGQLRDMGVLTEAEFDAKKAELLARL